MTAFYIAGGILAIWAVVLSALGVMSEGFPKTAVAERLVGAISVVLVLAAILSAVIGGAIHASHEEEGDEKEAALLLSR